MPVTQANNYSDTIPQGALLYTLPGTGKPSYSPMGQAVPAGAKVTGTRSNPNKTPGGYVTVAGKAKYLNVGGIVPAGAKAWNYSAINNAIAHAALPYRYQTAYDDLSNSIAHIKAVTVLETSRAQVENFYKYCPAETRGILVPNGYPYLQTGMYGASTNTWPRIVPIQPFVKDTDVITWTNPNVNAPWAEKLAAAYPGLKSVPASAKASWATIIGSGKVALRDSKGQPCAWYYHGAFFAVNWAAMFDHVFQAGNIYGDPTSGYYQQTYKSYLALDFFESARNLVEAAGAAIGIAYVAAAAVGSTAAGTGAATGADASATDIGTTDIITTAPEAGGLPTVAGTDLTSGLTTLAPVSLAGAAADVGGLGSLLKAGTTILGVAAAAAAKKAATPAAKPAAPKAAGTAAPSTSLKTAIFAAVAGLAGIGLLVAVAQGA